MTRFPIISQRGQKRDGPTNIASALATNARAPAGHVTELRRPHCIYVHCDIIIVFDIDTIYMVIWY